MNYGINNLWPTHVLLDIVSDKDLNNQIVTELLMNKDSLGDPDTENLFDLDNLIIDRFKKEIVIPAFDRYLKEAMNSSLSNYPDFELRAWVTGWSSGYRLKLHNHRGSEFSSVFYIISEEQSAGGDIVFVDPRSNANRGYDLNLKKHFDDVVYQPRSGEFLIFPSFLYHQVIPYYSNLRMAIPVDIFLGPYTE